MGDEHHRDGKAILNLQEFLAHLGPEQGVQGGKRLIQEQQAGAADEGPGQGHPLALTSGQVPGEGVLHGGQLKNLQHLIQAQPFLMRQAPAPAFFQAEGDVLGHRQVGEKGVILENVTHVPAAGRHLDIGRGIEQDPVAHHDAAGIRSDQAGDGLERHGLAGPRGTEKDHDVLIRGKGCFQEEDPFPGPQAFFDIHRDFHDETFPAAVWRPG